ncbi:hypothetical protein QQS21_000465 [Conoideocrella luteorostrata]|uniref:NAD(P)-binding protein n=1 Tax=Conoideocrella luteorostrata TaxID=1105319 RepID=A0AAJ0G2K1_9HYPO|nr:hypothetical protein QQS21_000465 [Conoideocrella luteorostrata]
MCASRIAVVTGASRGLGLEWVRQLSEDPQTFVIAVVRNPEKAKQTSTLSRQNVVVVKADLSDLKSFSTVAANISELSGGKIDILINNAGLMLGEGGKLDTKISKSTPEQWTEEFNVNVLGAVFFTITLIPLLENGTEKKVVNITSMLADLDYTLANPDLQFATYSVTKASVILANAKFHTEFKERGFTFLALNPGWVNTDLGGIHVSFFKHFDRELES